MPVPAWALFVWVGLACQEVGAAFAVLLFPEAGPLGMVLLHQAMSVLEVVGLVLVIIASAGAVLMKCVPPPVRSLTESP
ncbi:hypothetical protein [Microbacterium amylolyticum]|uniref:Threonine/homoserine efflux transporter RhtA n=1 Tax=Microbacterium amylolyticum TaxID=936337 RepID=A0ABS4ZIA6_9MICO|nr:hypothetical protein [Microbacterium amylolyticum]MBP2437008.1 threonine/homoserine efflux transporter RhtA [Microbacterium amylolyticum]